MLARITALMSGAAFMAGFAHAADLPSSKSAPVQFVRICDAYGSGFFYIPGTNTCLRLGGRVRAEYIYTPPANAWRHATTGNTYGTAGFVSKNAQDTIGWNVRGYFNVDARTQSAWGTVQTVMVLRMTSNSGLLANNYGNGTFAASNGFGASLDAGYIRFAGFTFGRAAQNFTFLPGWTYNTDYFAGFPSGVKQLAYTATFGGGFSATIALEDSKDYQVVAPAALGVNGSNVLMGAASVASTATAVGPSRLPAVVSNIRVDQAWGTAQLMAAAMQNTANFATPAALAVTNGNGPLMKRTGWAVGAGLKINLPMIARGDELHLTGGYTVGMLDMLIGGGLNGYIPKNGRFMGGLLRLDRNMTIFECGPAGVFVACSEQTKAWHAAAIFLHYWSPTVRQHVQASYTKVTPGLITRNTDWQQGGLSAASAYAVGTTLIWSPVQRFDIGLEVTYANMRQSFAALPGAAPSPITTAAGCTTGIAPCAVGLANFKISPHIWAGRVRIQRDF